jgi:hypothetical protein
VYCQLEGGGVMSRRESWFLQERINHMVYRATFFRQEIMTKPQPPTLTYGRRKLEPYHVEQYGDMWVLYYTSDTPENTGWTSQLAKQGYSCRYGRLDDRSIEVVARRLGQ